ncbi:MAG: 16S rRNA (cytidine(1402)-2'-O)-methyltransferase [Acidimicrobiia bacterium]|nr:16S rRNA (cytidine(1402)-2'-O)-methyltransferase [bacterium]MCY3580428.1 16S rRNA (cytidine(1402)-2'-O)-methyltransferase [bacterium]MDE0644250.1 16S rRNA (cytidine(1402)-2'-O)-methyltransferase [bacterium]MXZ06677.1 16S rRNA (cytidine(1402)-2'-O)-methyltransferase [Acidimicrobiia bacterium]MYF25912.1 16S rRNA (cytidine(1402)-2'-O)-methyltransferase [Acidimicrobiia bacterium]
MTGRLVLCSTPIGNLGDISTRLAETLGEAHLILAEDTRRARILLNHLGIGTRPVSYHLGNEADRSDWLAGKLAAGALVALITDAGTPAIGDPGLSAVRSARRVGATVSIVPGPSAVVAALAVSGLPSERFVFEGFLPRQGGDRRARLDLLAVEQRTIVLFSAPTRVAQDLADLAQKLGDQRPVTVVRELTKVHEEVWSGGIGEAAQECNLRMPRGEFTLVLEGSPPPLVPLEQAVEEVKGRMEQGEPMSEAVRHVAKEMEMSRRMLYQAVLQG